MRKPVLLIAAVAVCMICTSCGRKYGTITSSSRFVTPMMIQQIQEKLDNMPEPAEEGAATEILKADVLSAFKSDDEKEETVPEQQKPEKALPAENAESKPPEMNSPETKQTDNSKPKKESGKTKIDTVAGEETVYVSGSGKKFHKTPDCSNMASPVGMTRNEAENDGKTYCKKCYE